MKQKNKYFLFLIKLIFLSIILSIRIFVKKVFMFKNAITRTPGMNFSKGITTSNLCKPNYNKTLQQHQSYCSALEKCGVKIKIFKADNDFPDSTFVEDTAVVTERCVIITRPGNKARLGEEVKMEKLLSKLMNIHKIHSPGTLDGGDILRAENHFFIGVSARTNKEGAKQLTKILGKYGYSTSIIYVGKYLHLKSGANYIGKNIMVLTHEMSKYQEFEKYVKIIVPEEEKYAANCIEVNGRLFIAAGFPETKKLLTKTGYDIVELNMSEFEKMDGGLSCLSLRF